MCLAGCGCLQPQRSCHRSKPVEAKLELVRRDYDEMPFTGPSMRMYRVFCPKGALAHREGPPVLLLHEMPALNAETLELAERIASHGYRVYVPLLFGDLRDNPQDRVFALRHVMQKRDDPMWRAAQADVRRPVVKDLAELARKIVRENQGRRLGVVGNCFTGILPLALCDRVKKHSLGIAPEELDLARERIRRRNLEVLGFRFEGDVVSPRERFTRLHRELNEGTGALHFRDRTLLAAQYHDADGLPLRAHPVLTDGFRRWLPGQPEPATHYAYRELIAFLDAKLKGPRPRRFVPPPHFTDPPPEAAGEIGGWLKE